jgi:hypothetical protein
MVTRSGHSFDSLRSLRAGRLPAVLLFFILFSGAIPSTAAAQSSIQFNGGASIDPEQAYAGVAWESPDIGGRFRLRPGLDGGFGNGLRLGTFNFDLIVKFPLGQTGWSLIQGGGPTIVVVKFSDAPEAGSDLHAGGSYLFGFRHKDGFFTEFRIGGGGSYVPSLKIGAGWSVEIK